MATGLVSWSQTASSNANADSNANWAEGMSPSQVNDSARAIMASMAKWRDDNTGTLVTTGTAGSYTLTSNQVFTSLSAMDGQTITFKVHATNLTTATTLSVDGLGAKSVTLEGLTPIPQGFLYANAIIDLIYNNSLSAFVIRADSLSGFTLIPTGLISLIAGGGAVSAYWIQCNGQAVSRTTYAGLFAGIGTSFGAGDGSTTFNVPTISDVGGIHYFIHV